MEETVPNVTHEDDHTKDQPQFRPPEELKLIPWKKTKGPVRVECPSCGAQFTGSDVPEPKMAEDVKPCPDCGKEYDHANEDRCPNCHRWTGR